MLLLAFGGPDQDCPINHDPGRMFHGAIGNSRTEKSAPNAFCITPADGVSLSFFSQGLKRSERRAHPIPFNLN